MQEIRMEQTEGLGRLAQVWVGGALLTVCDGVSEPERRCPPGVLTATRFKYVSQQGVDLATAVAENPAYRRELEPLQRWSYIGYGRIKSIMPVVIDFGLITMEAPQWTNDESLVGQFVALPIDRLEIVNADALDFPEEFNDLS
jgi:hypothetical protein